MTTEHWLIVAIVAGLFFAVCGVARALDMKVVFFYDFLDVAISFLFPAALIALFIIDDEDNRKLTYFGMWGAASGASVYSFARAFAHNRRRPVSAFCVGVGRLVFGYFVPFFALFATIFGGPRKAKGETEAEYRMRAAIEKATWLAALAGLAVLLMRLVNGKSINRATFRGHDSGKAPDGEMQAPKLDYASGPEPSANRQVQEDLSSPEIVPVSTDGTIEAWLVRIGLWGNVRFSYQEPNAEQRLPVQQSEFLNRMNDESRTRMFGRWGVVKDGLSAMHFERTFVDTDDEKKVERLFVEVDLKPEVKKALEDYWSEVTG